MVSLIFADWILVHILIDAKLHISCLAVRAVLSNDYAYLLIQYANKVVVPVVVRALV